MNTIKITEKRMNDILPVNIIESDVISDKAKMVLATIMNYHYVLDVCKESGYLVISNETLRESVGGRKDALLPALQELIDYDLIIRERGCKREAGKKSIASKYYVRWENLRKELKKKSSDDLISSFLNTSKKGLGPVDVDAVIDIDSVIESDIVFDIDNDIEYVIVNENDNVSDNATECDTVSTSNTFNQIKKYIDIKLKEKLVRCYTEKEVDNFEDELILFLNGYSNIEGVNNLKEVVNRECANRRCGILVGIPFVEKGYTVATL